MELQVKEEALREAKENLQLAVEAVADEASTIIEDEVKAIEEFKASDEFRSNIIKGSLVAYDFSLDACMAQVAHFFLRVNTNQLDPYLRIGGED
ncbi:putative methyltransferase PMT21 [Cocos nucifera]|uniref:Putative methyltransferase PMT21 n=1 Tax=Cocos nucifera TaxID=13894 RepID=A0A8K0I0W7_COCNU|nr:putative methyltransferase PMT21 [Cocos nucifera]